MFKSNQSVVVLLSGLVVLIVVETVLLISGCGADRPERATPVEQTSRYKLQDRSQVGSYPIYYHVDTVKDEQSGELFKVFHNEGQVSHVLQQR